MAPKLPDAKLIDLVTTIDSEVFTSQSGPMAWGTIEVCYISEGYEPKVTIKVPVPVLPAQSEAQQRDEALRRARTLIDHACVAMGSQPAVPPDLGEMLEGLAEELGIRSPTTKSARRA